MYDRFIFPAGFRCLVRSALCFFFCFWCICGPALADRFDTVVSGGFSPISSSASLPSIGTYFTLSSPYLDRNYYLSSGGTVNQGGIYSNPGTNSVSYGHSGYVVSGVSFTWYQQVSGKWRIHTAVFTVSISSTPPNVSSDSDSDGIKDDIDPCIDSPDDNYTIYRLKNHCTGSYYIFQVTGSCGKTKTYFNPIYTSLSSALDDASNSPECNPVGNGDRISMGALAFENWFDSHHGDVGDGGELPDQSVPDPTGGNSTSPSVPPSQVDPDNPSNQKLLDQIERLKAGLENTITAASAKVANEVQIAGANVVSGLNRVQGAVNGLGSGISSVGSAIGSASSLAHSDANMLAQKLDAINTGLQGLGGGNATVSGGMSAEEMDASLQKNREETYKVESGAFDSIESSQQGFFNTFTSRATELKNRVLNLIPDLAVDANAPDPCVPESTVSLAGYSVVMPEICLDRWEQYFILLGNVLYAAAGIGCILTIFGFRG